MDVVANCRFQLSAPSSTPVSAHLSSHKTIGSGTIVPSISSSFRRNTQNKSGVGVRTERKQFLVRASNSDLNRLGDVGARDPYCAEVESRFGDKVLGNADTEHRIKLPEGLKSVVGLAGRGMMENTELSLLSEEEARALLRKLVGWKLVGGDALRLRAEWRVRDFSSGLVLFSRIAQVAEKVKHHPDLHLEGYNNATAEIWTHSLGGLTINDFILAAKIDEVPTNDLMNKKKRFWA